MASKALQAFRRTVSVDWPKHADAQAKALLLRTARHGHAEIMKAQSNPSFEAYANRPGNSNLDGVVLPGPIVYNYSNVRQMVEFALDELRKASPVDAGDYVRGHTLFVNGLPVDVLPTDLKPTDEIMITNREPYSRKLEVGKTTSGRDFLVSVPNKIYERVAKRKLMPRYRNVAKITYAFVTLPDAGRLKHSQRARSWLANKGRWHYAKTQRRDRVSGSAIQSPAIIISQLV